MPQSRSARKRDRQAEKRRARNRTIKSRIRTARRAFLNAIADRDLEGARQRFRLAERLLHRAASNGPVHRNTTARVVSRMQLRLARLEKEAR